MNPVIRTLVVNDNPQFLDLLKHALSKYSLTCHELMLPDIEFEYLAALNRDTAITLVRKHYPHICLVKVVVEAPYSYASLKEEPGVLLINRLKKMNPSVKCIAHCECTPERKLYYLLKELNADDCIPYHATTGFVAKKLHVVVWEYGLDRIP